MAKFGDAIAPLRALLEEVVDRGWQAGQHRGWRPRAGSPGDLDRRDARWGMRTDPDVPSPVEFGHSVSSLVLMAAHDHVQAVGRLLGPPPSVYGMVAVARAAIEASARVAWLCDLKCDRRTRALRYLTQHMHELRWQTMLPLADARGSADADLARLAHQAAAAGFDVRRDPSGRLSKVEIEDPKLEWLVGDLAREGGRDQLVTMYRLYSHSIHGGPFALTRAMRVNRDNNDPGVGVISRVIDPREAAQMTGVVALAAVHGSDKLASLFGWDNAAWKRWVRATVARASQLIAQDASPTSTPDDRVAP